MQLELTEQILKHIEQRESADTLDLASEFNEDHQKIVGALKSIQSHGELVNAETTSRKAWQVTDEGQFVIEHGSHEACVFNAIPAGGIAQPELMKVSNTGSFTESSQIASSTFRHLRTPRSASARPCHMDGSLLISPAELQSCVERWTRSTTWFSSI